MIFRRFAVPVRLLLIAVLLLPWAAAPAEGRDDAKTPSPPQSILFVGNSFTFYNNAIYTHLRGLLVADDPSNRQSVFVKSMTISGAVLGDHQGGLDQMLALRPWAVVVLQGHSLEAIEPDRRPGLVDAAGRFGKAILDRGARPVLFMTWAYAGQPEMTPRLVRAYTEIGRELDMMVVPVGLAFDDALKTIAGLRLHHADRIHPSLEGTYLAACVFYATLFDARPDGLTSRIDDAAGESLVDLPVAQALILQKIAWDSVVNYRRHLATGVYDNATCLLGF